MHVSAGSLADVRHRIDEAQTRGEEGIGGVFGELCCDDVGYDHWCPEDGIQLGESSTHRWFGGPNQNAIGVEEVTHCTALAQKLWVRRDVHVSSTDDARQSCGRARRHR